MTTQTKLTSKETVLQRYPEAYALKERSGAWNVFNDVNGQPFPMVLGTSKTSAAGAWNYAAGLVRRAAEDYRAGLKTPAKSVGGFSTYEDTVADFIVVQPLPVDQLTVSLKDGVCTVEKTPVKSADTQRTPLPQDEPDFTFKQDGVAYEGRYKTSEEVGATPESVERQKQLYEKHGITPVFQPPQPEPGDVTTAKFSDGSSLVYKPEDLPQDDEARPFVAVDPATGNGIYGKVFGGVVTIQGATRRPEEFSYAAKALGEKFTFYNTGSSAVPRPPQHPPARPLQILDHKEPVLASDIRRMKAAGLSPEYAVSAERMAEMFGCGQGSSQARRVPRDNSASKPRQKSAEQRSNAKRKAQGQSRRRNRK